MRVDNRNNQPQMGSFCTRQSKQYKSILMASVLAIFVSACSDDDDDYMPTEVVEPVQLSYQIEVINLTKAQPMSNVTVVLHNEGKLWNIGEPASAALEQLAESGDNSGILGLNVVLASNSGEGILMPGMSQTIMVNIDDEAPMHLSLATMLVNTNDAFTGINAAEVKQLALGESISFKTSSYDSGTEMNSELMASIPGPAGGGEGYNMQRDDVDVVAMHPGVVTADDGLMQSALSAVHKFDNPTLDIKITRTQ